ncbi:MAG: stage 0 sporulation protein, partial [Tissierellia bacterium]|nr:stage 0 sporulation protein [Tissierellia bacterium]
MIEVVGIRFKKVGKIYYFNPSGFNLALGDDVIVETVRGVEYGQTVIINR